MQSHSFLGIVTPIPLYPVVICIDREPLGTTLLLQNQCSPAVLWSYGRIYLSNYRNSLDSSVFRIISPRLVSQRKGLNISKMTYCGR